MVCQKNICDYDSYYKEQAGGNLDINYYRDIPYQRGGNLKFAKRYAIPVLKYLGKQAFYAGKDILSDIKSGVKPSVATKKALRKRAASVLGDLSKKMQSGSGLRKKPRISKRKRKSNKRKPVSRKRVIKVRRRKSKKRVNKPKKLDIFRA